MWRPSEPTGKVAPPSPAPYRPMDIPRTMRHGCNHWVRTTSIWKEMLGWAEWMDGWGCNGGCGGGRGKAREPSLPLRSNRSALLVVMAVQPCPAPGLARLPTWDKGSFSSMGTGDVLWGVAGHIRALREDAHQQSAFNLKASWHPAHQAPSPAPHKGGGRLDHAQPFAAWKA